MKVYSSNSRIAGSTQLTQTYRLSIKTVDGRICTRLDLPQDDSKQIAARSFITDGKTIVVTDSATGAVQYRGAAPAELGSSVPSMEGKYLFQKIDPSLALASYRSISCSIADEQGGKIKRISVPSSMLRTVEGQGTPRSFTLFLDTENGTLAGSEAVSVESNGTVVTTKETRFYKGCQGAQVPIGAVTEIHYDIPGVLDVSDRSIPRVDDLESIPTVTQEEVDAHVAAGDLVISPPALLGDPSDPDYSEISTQVYEDVALNGADDSLFRIPN